MQSATAGVTLRKEELTNKLICLSLAYTNMLMFQDFAMMSFPKVARKACVVWKKGK